MFLMSALAACSLVSCNESDSDFARYSAFAVVHAGGISGGYYFECDDHTTLYPGDTSRVPELQGLLKDGARVIVAYNLLDDAQKVPGYDYTIAVYGVDMSPAWGETAVVADEEAMKALGDTSVVIFQNNLLTSTKEILTIALGYYAKDITKHRFTLVSVEDEDFAPEVTDADYLNLQICHSIGDDTTSGVSANGQWISFRLDDFEEQIAGTKGVIIGMKDFENKMQYHKVDWTTFEGK